MKPRIVFPLLIFFFLLCGTAHAQTENSANVWYFGDSCGLDFNLDPPEILYDGGTDGHCSSAFCDSSGQFVLYTDGMKVFNAQHLVVEGGDSLLGIVTTPQGNLIVPQPLNPSIYYVFNTYRTIVDGLGLHYCIVDMAQNNGLGKVIQDNKLLSDAWDASEEVLGVKHQNNQDYWIITKKFFVDSLVAFRLTGNGLITNGVMGKAFDAEDDARGGFIKISYDKKFIIDTYIDDKTSVYTFDPSTGQTAFVHNLLLPTRTGLEFSPDSKYIYLSDPKWDNLTSKYIYEITQYEMRYILDPPSFRNSGVIISRTRGFSLQMGRDGKIYGFGRNYDDNFYASVINEPWKKGVDCGYVENAFNFFPGHAQYGIPNVVMDYNLRFFFAGFCAGEPFNFQHNFLPMPDSLHWDFGDTLSGANNFSSLFDPSHVFSQGGTFRVSVDVWYASGRYEHTSREVEVLAAPQPDLGPDLLVCQTEEVLLWPNAGAGYYTWNTGSHDTAITVSDTGWYWVRIKNTLQCSSTDSIHIALQSAPTIDSSLLEIIPTGCGGSTGQIHGLAISGTEPFSFQWINDEGQVISTALDISGLSVGNYTLLITDGTNCQWPLGPFAIEDAGDIEILSVETQAEHCGQNDGSISIQAHSGFTNKFLFSIDNGTSFIDNEGLFTNLSSGSYAIRVSDTSGCQSAWAENPIILQMQKAPWPDSILILPEINAQSDGGIILYFNSSIDTFYCSNNNGIGFQFNNGSFQNQEAGFYDMVIKDQFGCDTTFVIEVPNEITIKLEAIAGDGDACPGNSIFAPLLVNNFANVGSFDITILYEQTQVECTAYANANENLEAALQVQLYPGQGKLKLHWSGGPINLEDGTPLCDLVFMAKESGFGQMEWQNESSYFADATGKEIAVEFFSGNLRVYNDIELQTFGARVCQGDFAVLTSLATGGNGNITYDWTLPDGTHQNGENIAFMQSQPSDSGTYFLSVTDIMGCTASAQLGFIVDASPRAAFANRDTMTFDQALVLDAGPGQQSYLWNNGDTSHAITITEEGWYKVQMQSQAGCLGIDSVFALNVFLDLYVPNAFSPNGDGQNDVFKVVLHSSYIPNFTMIVYNRWGQKIFESHDALLGWDGKFNGNDCPMGAYIYQIVYDNLGVQGEATAHSQSGSFVLLR
jgi:gliding motility-associated-like protein